MSLSKKLLCFIFVLSLSACGGGGDKTGEEDICDSSHLNLCAIEADCTSANGYWYNDSCNTVKIVDAASVGPNLKGLEFSDKNKNIVTTYVSDELPDDSVEIVDGVNLGKPEKFKILTHGFIEITYPPEVTGRQTVKIKPSAEIYAVIVHDPKNGFMKKTPFIVNDDNEVEFKVNLINGKIVFSLVSLSE